MTDHDTLLQRLAEPFPPSAISWKPGSVNDGECLALAYADLRAYQDRLDEVCGLDWSVSYQGWGDRIICHLTIGGITRSATGEADRQDAKNELAGSVAEAMAFKRAAAMFGMGRYLYKLPFLWVAFDATKKRITRDALAGLDKRYSDWYYRKIKAAQPAESDREAEATDLGGESSELLGNEDGGDVVTVADAKAYRNGTHSEISFDDIPGATEQRTNGRESSNLLGNGIPNWRGPLDAQMWAMEIGACANEYEARNSWKKVVQALGGAYSPANKKEVFKAFHERQTEKLGKQVA